MDIRKLQRAIVDGLEDVKAQDIAVFNTEHLSPLFERVIIASGTSNRQTRSLANSVREAVKGAGLPVPRTEGEDNGEWIIVDCGSAVVHVMQPPIRAYYHLEELWGEKPVKMKLGRSSVKLVKASEPDDAADLAGPAEPSRPLTAARRRAALAPSKGAGTDGDAPASKKRRTADPVAAAAKRSSPREAVGTAIGKKAARKGVGAAVGKTAARKGVTRTVGVKKSAAAVRRTPRDADPAAKASPVRKRAAGPRTATARSVAATRTGSRPAKTAAVRKPTRKA